MLICLLFAGSFVAFTNATLDLSNLDLLNFQFFKYPKTTEKPLIFYKNGYVFELRKIPKRPGPIENSFNHAKAAISYLKEVALGNPDDKIVSEYKLDPEFGAKWTNDYKKKFGKHGELLVNLLGAGASKQELMEKDAISI
ncbi:unnamed protein product [Diamesa serratosioi]